MSIMSLLKYFAIAIVLFLLLVSLPKRMVYNIAPGHCGVLVSRVSGVDKQKVYNSGTKIIAPWDRLVIYDVRIQADTQTINVLSKDGVRLSCVVSYFFQLDKNRLGNLNDEIIPEFKTKIIAPEVMTATWKVIGQYQAIELYNMRREVLQQQIQTITAEALYKKYILLDKILVKDIVLPAILQHAIEQNAALNLPCGGAIPCNQ